MTVMPAASELLKAVRAYTGQIQMAKAKAATELQAAAAAAESAARLATAEAEEAEEQRAREEWGKANPGGVWKPKPGTHRDSPYLK